MLIKIHVKEEISHTAGSKQFNYEIHFHEKIDGEYEFDVKEEITQPGGGKQTNI